MPRLNNHALFRFIVSSGVFLNKHDPLSRGAAGPLIDAGESPRRFT